MSVITVYESRWCGYCMAARRLLKRKGWDYDSLVVDGDPALREHMQALTGRHTVPQIFIGDTHVGGFDDMAELDVSGELDTLYAAAIDAADSRSDG